jgi:hypothetical protein
MVETGATLIESRTSELIDAYREVRREVDKSGFWERTAALAYLVDSSGSAYRALEQRHSAPGATESLKAVHDAFAADDLMRRANMWRKRGFGIMSVLFGVTGVSVILFSIKIISMAASESRSIIAAGGAVMLLFAAGGAVKAGIEAFMDSKKLSATEERLRPVEIRYFEIIGGSPPRIDRVDLLRVAGALAQICILFAIQLVLLGLLYAWLSRYTYTYKLPPFKFPTAPTPSFSLPP